MAQLNDVQPLEDALAVLLQQLAPPARRTLMRELAKTLRQRQKKHIQAQKNPDGSPYIPRKRRVRDKHGRLRRTMFTRLHTARFMKTASTPESASVSFTPAVEHLTRVHHYGLRDRISRHGPTVRYARRKLLGFTDADRDWIADLALAHLAR